MEFFKRFQNYKNRVALKDNENSIFYKDLIKNSQTILKKIKANSIALLIAKNNISFINGYISFLKKKNIISILADDSFDSKFIKKIIFLYKPNYIFFPNSYKKKYKKIKLVYKFSDYIIVKTSYPKHKNLNYKNYLLLSTSGSTHNPKFVRLSKNNLEFNINKINSYLKINKFHNTITTMPLGYSYGLSILNSHLSKGAKIIINNNSVFEKKFWIILEKEKITSFGGVPEFYEYLKKLNFDTKIPESLKYVTQAGGKLDNKILEYYGNICKIKNFKFYVMYGQAEASPRMTYLEWDNFFKSMGSVGKPIKNCSVVLQDRNNKLVNKEGKIGEIIFKGKNVCLGYANSLIDLYKGDENKGTLYTGDLGKFDKHNNLYIIGRKDKLVKIFGKRFNLFDLEKFLKRKKIIIKCNYKKPFLEVYTKEIDKKEKIKKIISNFLNLNQNYILIKKGLKKTFKDYKI